MLVHFGDMSNSADHKSISYLTSKLIPITKMPSTAIFSVKIVNEFLISTV